MLKQHHVTTYGTLEQPKSLTNSDFLKGYEQFWVSYWVCVPLPSLLFLLSIIVKFLFETIMHFSTSQIRLQLTSTLSLFFARQVVPGGYTGS
jgi:hypothetical protein